MTPIDAPLSSIAQATPPDGVLSGRVSATEFRKVESVVV